VLGPALADDRVLAMAARLVGEPALAGPAGEPALAGPAGEPALPGPTGEPALAGMRAKQGGRREARIAAGSPTTLVVVGHHLSDQPRSADLTDRGGVLVSRTSTAPSYRLLRVGDGAPVPALVRVASGGAAIEVETWLLPAAGLAEVLSAAADSVCLGRVRLADGSSEIGFVADASVFADPTAFDITQFGGWRAYLAAQQADQHGPLASRPTSTPPSPAGRPAQSLPSADQECT